MTDPDPEPSLFKQQLRCAVQLERLLDTHNLNGKDREYYVAYFRRKYAENLRKRGKPHLRLVHSGEPQ